MRQRDAPGNAHPTARHATTPGPDAAIFGGAGACARAHVLPQSRACLQPRMRAHACTRLRKDGAAERLTRERRRAARAGGRGAAPLGAAPASNGRRTETSRGRAVKSQTSKKERKSLVPAPRGCGIPEAALRLRLRSRAVARPHGVLGARGHPVSVGAALRRFVTHSYSGWSSVPAAHDGCRARASSAQRGPLRDRTDAATASRWAPRAQPVRADLGPRRQTSGAPAASRGQRHRAPSRHTSGAGRCPQGPGEEALCPRAEKMQHPPAPRVRKQGVWEQDCPAPSTLVHETLTRPEAGGPAQGLAERYTVCFLLNNFTFIKICPLTIWGLLCGSKTAGGPSSMDVSKASNFPPQTRA